MVDQQLTKWLDERRTEATKMQEQINKVVELVTQFPDLSYSYDRWKTFRLHSAKVNPIATDVEIKHSCGCCSDSPLYARPYIITNNEKVFSCDCFTIGEKAYGGGDQALPGWRTKLLSANVPQEIVDMIEKYFQEHPVCKDEEDGEEPFV